jgi:hypothetical protein
MAFSHPRSARTGSCLTGGEDTMGPAAFVLRPADLTVSVLLQKQVDAVGKHISPNSIT